MGVELVRRYALGYATGARSLLESIQLVGADGETALPTLRYSYTGGELTKSGELVSMTSPPGRSPVEPSVALSDLNGDGLPDLLVGKAGSFRSYVNHDGKSWQPAVDWQAADSPSVSLEQQGVSLADFDGDGAIDLVAKSGISQFRYFPGLDATHWSPSVAIPTVPNLSFEDPDVRLADLDGDRRIDFVATSAAGLVVGTNLGGKDFASPKTIGVIDPKQELRFSNGKTHLTDVNGDGLLDLAFLRSGALSYWLGRGRGVFEASASASGVPAFSEDDPYQLVDLNGDGLVDLVHLGVTQVSVARATAAGQFADVVQISGTPNKAPGTFAGFADMNGSGTTDIVWVDTSGSPESAWRYLELFPKGRAGLMTVIDNGLGKITRISYEPAAQHAARARDAGKGWSTRMNIAMPVVSRVETDMSLGDPLMATEYLYRDGAWDAVERTFAGFAGGVERALGDEYTPTLLTDTSFDLGLTLRSLRGAVLTHERRNDQGQIFDRTANEYTSQTVASAGDGTPISYGYKSSERVEYIEGTDPSAARTTLTEWEEDSYGNQIAEYRWGEVVAGDKLVGTDEALTVRTFANDATEWILGRPATEELTDASGARVRMTRSYYDGDPFVGMPLGKLTRGDLTRQEAWVGPGLDEFDEVVASKYDAHGNPVETRDAKSGVRAFDWDDAGVALVAEHVETGQRRLTQRVQYDARFGAIIRFEDFNGVATAYQYDSLGRITGIARPGDSAKRPTVGYAYELAAPISRVITTNRIVSGGEEATRFITVHDGANRPRATLFEADEGRWVLSEVAVHDARGETRRKLRPRLVDVDFVDSKALADPSPGDDSWRDAATRVVSTRSHAGRVTKQSYGPLVTRSWDASQADPASPYEHTPVVETRDGQDRVVRREFTLGGSAVAQKYTWTVAGELAKRIDAEGHATSYAYDGRGRRIEAKDPNAGTHSYIYDASDNLVEHRYPDKKASHFEHDLAGRTVREDWDGDGQSEVTRFFDEGTNALGRLARVEDPSGTTVLSYDERGRVAQRSVRIGTKRYDTSRQYDAQDRESLHVYPDGSSVRLRYDGRGLLAGLGRDAVTLHHDADETETVREYSTGVRELFGYDQDRRLNAHKVVLPDGAVVQHIAWTLDAVGNVAEQSDLRSGIPEERSRSVRYSYDNLYRLVRSEGAWGHSNSEYSAAGRLLSRTSSVAALNAGSLAYEPSRPHAVAKQQGRSLAYDARGRLVSDGERTLEWDGANHVVRVTTKSGATVENTFAADGSRVTRVERAASGTPRTTHFLDDWSEVVDGKLVRYLVVDGKRVARLSETNGVAAAGAAVPTPPPSKPHAQKVERLRVFLNGLWMALGILFGVLLAKRVFHRISAASWSRLQRAVGATMAIGLAVACSGADADKKPDAEGTVVTLTAADTLLLSDRVGSLTEITNGAGVSQGSSATYSFGETRWDEAPDENRVFAGTPRDRSVGLDLMEARYYSPDIGGFISPDPLWLDSPERVAALSPSHTAYSYAANNPSTLVDRDGREPDGLGAHQELERCTAQRGCSSAELREVQQLNRKGAEGAAEGLLFAATLLDGIALVRALPAAVRAAPKLLRAGADGVRAVVKGVVTRAGARGGPGAGTAPGKTVLGHFPAYVEKATELGARRFNVPTKVWDRMTPAQQWAANRKFLDRMIARGDDIVLATPAESGARW